jgi:hypothetical protein
VLALASGLPGALFFNGQFGRREDLEALVGDRFTTRDGETVGAGGEPCLGAFDGAEPCLEVVAEAFVELVLVEVGREVRRILVGLLGVVGVRAYRERSLEAVPLGLHQLVCALRIHSGIVRARERGQAAVVCLAVRSYTGSAGSSS